MTNLANSTAAQQAIDAVLAGQRQLVLACTGGGSGAVAALVQTPGASRVVLEAVVPYSAAALTEWLNAAPEQACSAATARAMAMAAWQRARQLATDTPPEDLVGVGCTASLATDRSKRGPHRVHVAVQSAVATRSLSLTLEKGARTRAEEEAVAAALVLDALAWRQGQGDAALTTELLRPGEAVEVQMAHAAGPLAELLCGRISAALYERGEWLVGDAMCSRIANAALFPGAFNPLHEGHRQMAALAAKRLQRPVIFEMSAANVDKPPLDFQAIQERLSQFEADAVLLTCSPTFVEKARLAPGAPMVVGADTIERIGQARYYGDDPAARDAALAELAAAGRRFLVFGRASGAGFQTLADLDLPPALAALCDGVDEGEFRNDVSSTALRNGGNEQ